MPEPYEIVERDDFYALVDSGDEVVVRFTADWCQPCKQLAPHLAKAAEARPDVKFVFVDVDKAQWSLVDFGIRGVPQVYHYKDGERLDDIKSRTALTILSELT